LELNYKKQEKRAIKTYDTKLWWSLNRRTDVLDRFSGGITITMVCKAMRKKGYGYAWQTGQFLMENGIHTVKKAKEFSDVIFEEFGVFIPYLELMGRMDAVTMDEKDYSEI